MSLIGMLAMWQANDALTSHDIHIFIYAAVVIAIALAIQSIVIVVAALGGMAIQKKIMADFADVKEKAMPLVAKVDALATQVAILTLDLTPTIKNITAKVDIIAGHAEHISSIARQKAEEFAPTISAANETVAQANETVRDANRKAQEQVARVNGMVSSVLDVTAQVGESIKRGIQIPGRELGGLASGIKAAFGALANRSKPRRYVAPVEFHQPYRSLNPSYRSVSDVPPDVLDEGTPGEPLQ